MKKRGPKGKSAAERWARIPCAPTYEVSTLGRVRGPAGARRLKYRGQVATVTLELPRSRGGERRTRSLTVARALLLAFRGSRAGGVPDYADGDPSHVVLTNVRWGTWRAVALRVRPRGAQHPHYGKKLTRRGWR